MVTIRIATMDDFEFFYELKSEDYNIFWTGGEGKPLKENILRFFSNVLNNETKESCRKIYIIENEKHERIGHLYIIPEGKEYGLSIAIISKFTGKGYGKEAIKLGLKEGKKLGFIKMVTLIREDNIASLKVFENCGANILKKYKEVYIPLLHKNVKMYFVEYVYKSN